MGFQFSRAIDLKIRHLDHERQGLVGIIGIQPFFDGIRKHDGMMPAFPDENATQNEDKRQK